MQRNHALSHIFIAQPEYEENSSYYEKLAETLPVIIIAEREFVLNSGSKLLVIHKPFSALSVANLLKRASAVLPSIKPQAVSPLFVWA